MLKNSENSWGWVSISIHWVSALTIFGLFALGLWMVELSYYDPWYRSAPDLHKSIGVSLLLLTLFRLFWRKINVTPLSLDSHTSFEKKTANRVHKIIYLLMFLIMFSGYMISTADGRGIEVFGLFEVPALIYNIEKQEDVAGVIHFILALSLIVLVIVHMLGALKHHFVDKDSTLKRMLGMC